MTTTTIETLTATALMGEVIATGDTGASALPPRSNLCESDAPEPPYDEKNTGPDFLEHFSGRDG